jgi:ribosomal protein S18 acetylase RimI-like enzyme
MNIVLCGLALRSISTMEEYVNPIIRLAIKNDEPFLWEMLYYAAHMDEDGEVSPEAAKRNPDLVKYVKDWGRETDVGSIALEPDSNQPIGAAWIRLLIANEKTTSYVDDATPELAIAVLPEYIGSGVGTLLLQHLLEAAKQRYTKVVLSVRATNQAKRLYERMGFVVTGEIANRIGTPSLNMVIQLH